MFFQNKQYKALEVIGTGKSTVQAILFCILWGERSTQHTVIRASKLHKVDMLGFFAAALGAVLMHMSWEVCGGMT